MRLSDEEILTAFDGDFKQVYFDHNPTPDDIMLIKLKLVVQATADKIKKDILEILNSRYSYAKKLDNIEAYFNKD